MPRHLTLGDIGRGASRHRAPRGPALARRAAVVVAALAAATVALPGVRALTGGDAVAGDTRCPHGTTRLVVAASPDTAPLLRRFAAEFSAQSSTGRRDGRGRCDRVTVVPRSPRAVLDELDPPAEEGGTAGPRGQGADGTVGADARPDVWSPPDATWLGLLRSRRLAAGRPPLVPDGAAPPLATSPLVVAMPRPMAQALGWPATSIRWADLLRLASDPAGWAAAGHPEWGPFRLGMTDPARSPEGLAGAIAAFGAVSPHGAGTPLTPADVAGATAGRRLAGLRAAVVRAGDGTTGVLSEWNRADAAGRGLRYLSALVTAENLVTAYNDGNPTADPALVGSRAKPRVPLVAVYPAEGTVLADHPLAVLDAAWVTPAHRAAADAFLAYLRSPAVQRALQANGFRGADGAPGVQASLALGVLPHEPRRLLPTPSAATVAAVLDGWAQLRGGRPRCGAGGTGAVADGGCPSVTPGRG